MATTTTIFNGKVEATTSKPTLKHRLAIVPATFGTYYAIDPAGVVRYFDYDLDGALAWAGVADSIDTRWAASGKRAAYIDGQFDFMNPSPTKVCLWVKTA